MFKFYNFSAEENVPWNISFNFNVLRLLNEWTVLTHGLISSITNGVSFYIFLILKELRLRILLSLLKNLNEHYPISRTLRLSLRDLHKIESAWSEIVFSMISL